MGSLDLKLQAAIFAGKFAGDAIVGLLISIK